MVTLFPHQQCHFFLRSIETWDVSMVTDMSSLFHDKTSCNPDISSWDVSKVTNFVSQFIAHSAHSRVCSEQSNHAESNTVLLLLNILSLLSSTIIWQNSSCFHRHGCLVRHILSIRTFPLGMLATEAFL